MTALRTSVCAGGAGCHTGFGNPCLLPLRLLLLLQGRALGHLSGPVSLPQPSPSSGAPHPNSPLTHWLALFPSLFSYCVVSDSVTPWTVAHQAPLSMGFPRQGYWSGLAFSSPGDLPSPRIELMSPALEGGFFTTEPPRNASSPLVLCRLSPLPPPGPLLTACAAPPHSWPLTPAVPLLLWLDSFPAGAPLPAPVTSLLTIPTSTSLSPQPHPDWILSPVCSPALVEPSRGGGGSSPGTGLSWAGHSSPKPPGAGQGTYWLPIPCTLQLRQFPVPVGSCLWSSNRKLLSPWNLGSQPSCLMGGSLPKPGLFASQLCHPPPQ